MEDRNEVGKVVEVGRWLEDRGLSFFALALTGNGVGNDLGRGWYQSPLRRIVIVSHGRPKNGIGAGDTCFLTLYA